MCWCWEWREKEGKPGEGKWTKPPIQCGTGWPAYASTDDPSTWGTYEAAVARVRNGQADGIGYCLQGADIGAADLDDCHDWDTKAIVPWAQAIIDRAPKGTYCEITVSGSGLRLIGKAIGKYLIRKLVRAISECTTLHHDLGARDPWCRREAHRYRRTARHAPRRRRRKTAPNRNSARPPSKRSPNCRALANGRVAGWRSNCSN